MSRIPVRTPSRSSSRNGSTREDPLVSGISTKFRSTNLVETAVVPVRVAQAPKPPSREIFKTPARPEAAARPRMKTVPRPPMSSGSGTTVKVKSESAARPAMSSTKVQPIRTEARIEVPKTPSVRKVKSSAGLREHIAKARAELQKSAKQDAVTMRVPGRADHNAAWDSGLDTQDGVEDARDVDDPFSTIKDPFNQAHLRPKLNPTIEQAIKRAREDGRLNISNNELRKVPDTVYNMYKPDPSHVIDFSMDSGSAWYDYTDLTYFNVADNELTTLEDEFVDVFGGVRTIDLHNNRLSALPQCLLQLSLLTTVNVAGNDLGNDAFELLCEIEGISELNFARNRLTGQLSSKLRNLQKLVSLDVSENAITEIGTALGHIPGLQRLNLSGNQVTHFCISQFSEAKHLVELDLGRNKLASPPVDASVALPRLERLNLANNALPALASNPFVLDLPALATLSLSQNRLTSLAGVACPELTTLDLAGNALDAVPAEALDCRRLRHLDLGDNRIATLDPRLGELPLLVGLRWQGNPLRARGSVLSLGGEAMLDHLRSRAAMERPDVAQDAGVTGS